jgi:hypothetical protein
MYFKTLMYAYIFKCRYDVNRTGKLSADDFRNIWRDAHSQIQSAVEPSRDVLFEAGLIFSRYEDGQGKLTQDGFERLIKEYPRIIPPREPAVYIQQHQQQFQTPQYTPQVPFQQPFYALQQQQQYQPQVNHAQFAGYEGSNPQVYKSTHPEVFVPKEVVSGLLLTHYDETAGVPISRSSIDQHRAMGNIVNPLPEAYKLRYDKLRHQLTSKLLPRREHVLQLRRQLQHTVTEVTAARKNIERETETDCEQILDRLRSAESMRQSAIKHQVLMLDEELESIERAVGRVEQANDQHSTRGPGWVLVTSTAGGAAPVEMYSAPKAVKMVELIQEYSDLAANIESLSIKPISVRVDFSSSDFPRETASRLEVIAKCDKYSQALAVKDQMLWTALKERDSLKKSLLEEQQLGQEYVTEVSKWADVAQSLSTQLTEMKQLHAAALEKNSSLANVLREHNIYYVDENQHY